MRKVTYEVAGETFTSYPKAVAFQNQLEAIHDKSFTLKTLLEEMSNENTEAKQKRREKVERVCS